MSWNRHPLFYSLKARTAFLYAGLFLISFAVIFGIVYLHLYLGKLETADRRLNGILSEFEYEYLTGEDFVSSLLPVTPAPGGFRNSFLTGSKRNWMASS